MLGSNRTITSYRLQTTSNKDDYKVVATVQGVPVFIAREKLETATFIDQENAFDVYRMTSDRDLDIQEHDKLTDNKGVSYTVHTVSKDDGIGYSQTVCLIQKVR